MPAWLRALLLLALLALPAWAACDAGSAAGDAPSPSASGPDPLPAQPAAPAALPQRIAASHILVSWSSAAGGNPRHRSASAARERAEALRARALAGEDFATLARENSDCPSAARGGFLGGFDRGTMDPAFEASAFALPISAISEVVESPFGFHVIRREPLAEIHAAQILVQFEGCPQDRSHRSREQAQERAALAWQRLEAGEPFEQVARELSDGAAGLRGGDLGWFTEGQFLPAWEKVAFALRPGETSPPFETGVGFCVVRRLE